MGMYDNIQGEVKCLNCRETFIADDQIKWRDCLLKYYTVGDRIPVADGEYDYGSWMRVTLDTQCPHCKHGSILKLSLRMEYWRNWKQQKYLI